MTLKTPLARYRAGSFCRSEKDHHLPVAWCADTSFRPIPRLVVPVRPAREIRGKVPELNCVTALTRSQGRFGVCCGQRAEGRV